MSKIGQNSIFAIILPWMARYGSKRSSLLIFSARDDLVKVSWKSDVGKCQPRTWLQECQTQQQQWCSLSPSAGCSGGRLCSLSVDQSPSYLQFPNSKERLIEEMLLRHQMGVLKSFQVDCCWWRCPTLSRQQGSTLGIGFLFQTLKPFSVIDRKPD